MLFRSVAHYLKQTYVDASKITENLISRYYDLISRPENLLAFGHIVSGRAIDHTAKLQHIAAPTLILWGKQDAWIPVQNAYRFRIAIPQADMILYDHLGHIAAEEDPTTIVQDIIQFIQ